MRRFKHLIFGVGVAITLLSSLVHAKSLDEYQTTNEVQTITIEDKNTIVVEPTKGKIGIKDQFTNSIFIREGNKGSLNEGIIRLEMDDTSYIEFSNDPKIEVVKGDIELRTLGWSNDNVYEIEITKTSTIDSMIQISGFNFKVLRNTSEKVFGLTISGKGLSTKYPNKQLRFEQFILVQYEDMESCSFPTQESMSSTIAFTIGSIEYTVNDINCKMDAAPYICNGRIMVPIRYAVEVMGIANEDVKFLGGKITIPTDKSIEMNIGSCSIKVGNEIKVMNVAPTIVNGRTYIPISEIAKLLNVQVKWNQEIQTVILIKQN